MYKLTYYFIYKLIEKRNPDAKFAAATFITLTQLIQLLFLYSLIRFWFNLGGVQQIGGTYFSNKLFVMPFIALLLLLNHLYFKRRFDLIEVAFKGKTVVNLKNGIKIFSLIFIPLIISILLSIK